MSGSSARVAANRASAGSVSALGHYRGRSGTRREHPDPRPNGPAPTRPPWSARAENWALTPREWQRHQFLMQRIRGSISPTTLSPIEALGIHARDATERNHFAERWAALMLEDAEHILAFQQDYDAAITRLVGEQRLIDRSLLPVKQPSQSTLAGTDRVLLFGVMALVDGLVRRDLRRWGAGRKSSFIYHWSKRSALPLLVTAWVICLALPFSLHPSWVILPFATLFAISIVITASAFKKYL